MPAAPLGVLYSDDVNNVFVRKGHPGETGWPFDVSGRTLPVRNTPTVT